MKSNFVENDRAQLAEVRFAGMIEVRLHEIFIPSRQQNPGIFRNV